MKYLGKVSTSVVFHTFLLLLLRQLRNCWTNQHHRPDLVPITTSLALEDKENDSPVDLMDQKGSSANDQNEKQVKEASNMSQLPETE